jgi:hypothetical protein
MCICGNRHAVNKNVHIFMLSMNLEACVYMHVPRHAAHTYTHIHSVYTVNVITFGSGKQLFPGLTATGINSVRGALPVEIIDSLHFKL